MNDKFEIGSLRIGWTNFEIANLLFLFRCVFLHVALPGQQPGAEDFPADFVFPAMGQIGLNLVTVLDHFRVKM